MALVGVVTELALIVATMLLVTTLVVVGPKQFITAVADSRWRLRVISMPLILLVSVLALRWSTRDFLPWLSWQVLGVRITPYLFEIERIVFPENPVTVLQSFQTSELTAFFVFSYIYGYAFLLIFPLIAYFVLDRMDHLSSLILAFTANYAIGLVCYLLFIAYGPRNFDPLLFEPILYEEFPQSRYLTDEVNHNVNVFPSLHTSLSVTVVLLAWHTRDRYPLWVPISAVLATSVVFSTMYLGIHWFSDVVAGIVLAIVSVYIGVNYTVEELGRSVHLFVETRLGWIGKPGRE